MTLVLQKRSVQGRDEVRLFCLEKINNCVQTKSSWTVTQKSTAIGQILLYTLKIKV